MSVDSGEARVANLRYQVYNRALHPEWFQVRAARQIAQSGWRADLRLIDGGHVLVCTAGLATFSEVLCAGDLDLPEAGLIHRSQVRQERSTSLGLNSRVAFHSCVEAERVDPNVFAHLHEELVLDATQSALFHKTRTANRMLVPAVGLMRVETRRAYLSIHSTHTFPEDRAIVRIESLIELK